ncbi:MAG: ribonuclease HII [Propionibacteriaceae bacterium]|nr:ribonuclease HII [Propionibacteriaceae bacterium]
MPSGSELLAELSAAGFRRVAGADEAGRGAAAGPLVAAAVILPPDVEIAELADSKRLRVKARERVYAQVVERALAWAVVEISPGECDELGMHLADLAGLRRALAALDPHPDFAVVDGFEVPGLPFPSLGMWKADQTLAPVSAASVVAKVTRDRLMAGLAAEYPEYGLEIHKGYCTAEHQRLLEQFGPSPIHRRCFGNVRDAEAARLCERMNPS